MSCAQEKKKKKAAKTLIKEKIYILEVLSQVCDNFKGAENFIKERVEEIFFGVVVCCLLCDK